MRIFIQKNYCVTLAKQVAIITGGTSGIGAETAMALAAEGADICVVARHPASSDFEDKIRALNVTLHVIIADLSKPHECTRAVGEAVAVFGTIHILVHCAGGAAPGGLLSGAADVWYNAFDIHVHAAFHLCQAVAPLMQKNMAGAIILVSSAAGLRGVKNALAYATVKGALPQFARALAFELAAHNIRVNVVSPGVIRTRFQDFLSPEQVKNNIENRIPLRREGKPADVAEVICVLIKNEFVTGENITIDGGMTMRIV